MEMKLRSNVKKKFLVDGGTLYSQADKFYPFRRHAVEADEVFGLIVQEHQRSNYSSNDHISTSIIPNFL